MLQLFQDSLKSFDESEEEKRSIDLDETKLKKELLEKLKPLCYTMQKNKMYFQKERCVL